jgi:hypothetical protein
VDGVTDAVGNSWYLLKAFSANPRTEVWATKATASLGTGSAITITFSGFVQPKAVTGWVFGYTGTDIVLDTFVTGSGSASSPPLSISGLSSLERLWIRCDALDRAIVTTYTADAGYTSFDHVGAETPSGFPTGECSSRGESRIVTATSQSTQPDVAMVSGTCRGVLLALSELAFGGGAGANVHYLPSDKTAFVLTNDKVVLAGAADFPTIAIPISSHHDGVLCTKMTMPASPGTPAIAQIQLSRDGTNWFTYRELHGPRAAATFSFSTMIPMGTHWLRLNVISSNVENLTISSYYSFIAGVT